MTEITTSFADGVFTLTFNRPYKRNAINLTMMKTVIAELNRTAEDDNVKIAVLTGLGDFYSSGNDFTPTEESNFTERLNAFGNLVAIMIDYPKPLVAVVNGPAIGMACTTLALCDIVYASDKAYFKTPFTRLGLVAEGCSTYTFPCIFGPARAAKLLYLNEVLTVEEAVQSGFITKVFPHHQLREQSNLCIKELALLPLQSLMMTKRLVRKWDWETLHQANLAELKRLIDRFSSADFINAITNPATFRSIKSKL